MRTPEKLSLIMLGIAITSAVAIFGYNRCTRASSKSHTPLVIDTLATSHPTDTIRTHNSDTITPKSIQKSAKSTSKRTPRTPKAASPDSPIPPRDYFNETT